MTPFPLEFSFKLNCDRLDILYFANKHDYQSQYAISWLSKIHKGKIDSTFYSATDVESLINKGTWVIVEKFK